MRRKVIHIARIIKSLFFVGFMRIQRSNIWNGCVSPANPPPLATPVWTGIMRNFCHENLIFYSLMSDNLSLAMMWFLCAMMCVSLFFNLATIFFSESRVIIKFGSFEFTGFTFFQATSAVPRRKHVDKHHLITCKVYVGVVILGRHIWPTWSLVTIHPSFP